MKTLLALTLMIPLLSCSFLGTKSKGSNPKPEGAMIAYKYAHMSTAMYPLRWYEVDRDGDGQVRIAWSEPNEPEIRVIRGPEDFFERVAAIVEEYRLYRLREHYSPRADIRDGYMWHAYFRFEQNSISAGGTNAWPKEKLWAGVEAVNAYIQSLIDASAESDVIARRSHDDRD